jgi:pimeloyl-ACP methyl ester carboxylesterase
MSGLTRTVLRETMMIRRAIATAVLLMAAGALNASAQQPLRLMDSPCTADTNAPTAESKTGRTFLLDYPCDLKAGEPVTFILNLHGGGSSGTWQRRYFPAIDQKEHYRLVVASPYSPSRSWSEKDDAYLQNIVTTVIDQIGGRNVKAFWLAGHSQGGATSRRIVCSAFFGPRVDGFLSLSGGRLGGAPERAPGAGRPTPRSGSSTAATTPAAGAAPAPPAPEPTCDFSFIYETGQHEVVALPATSALATKYQCQPRERRPDVVDTKAGQVHDGGSQNPGTKQWGLLPRPGTAEVFVYPGCQGGRVIADLRRLDKGHTEGLEPNVTEQLVKLMVSASGGKIQRASR